jgi:hypothetical protein
MNIHVLSMHEAKYTSMHVYVLNLDTWTLHFLGYIACVIDTNFGKTTKISNIPETGTLLQHGTDRNENFEEKKII